MSVGQTTTEEDYENLLSQVSENLLDQAAAHHDALSLHKKNSLALLDSRRLLAAKLAAAKIAIDAALAALDAKIGGEP